MTSNHVTSVSHPQPPSRLVVYIPTYQNPAGALRQVEGIAASAVASRSTPWSHVEIVVSINGGDYDEVSLKDAGATRVVRRLTDLGGDVNISLGLLEVNDSDFLWILSDNDPVVPSALTAIGEAFIQHPDAGMVVAVSGSSFSSWVSLEHSVLGFGGDFHAGLISGVVYRVHAIRRAVPFAMQVSWTGWTQIALQDQAIRLGDLKQAACVPVEQIITHTRGDQSARSVERARAAYSHSFFGGALLSYLSAEQVSGRGRSEFSTWWSRQWIYASAYRPPMRPMRSRRRNSDGSPLLNFRAGLVDAMARSGSARDRLLWLLSYVPYWRLGVFLRNRGFRSRWWS